MPGAGWLTGYPNLIRREEIWEASLRFNAIGTSGCEHVLIEECLSQARTR
ncbi:hypothetical protein NJ75_04376 [Novosphingobium subterraneum]|jgi:hypothetical protein|uniref:Uncharacterized protein n=1 Tax=Novosphingobium subterraneum TaxID=48936 RepID=A0A0B8ZG85_9SPHN|nr:hypothetical protein NJ75_04376 [Novosphingobium subterraneum]